MVYLHAVLARSLAVLLLALAAGICTLYIHWADEALLRPFFQFSPDNPFLSAGDAVLIVSLSLILYGLIAGRKMLKRAMTKSMRSSWLPGALGGGMTYAVVVLLVALAEALRLPDTLFWKSFAFALTAFVQAILGIPLLLILVLSCSAATMLFHLWGSRYMKAA